MTDTQVNEVVQEEAIDYKALAEQYKADLDKKEAHNKALFEETKKSKKEKEDAKLEAVRIAQEKAQKDGEFEKLWQTEAQQRKELEQKLAEFKDNIRHEKINNRAMQLANELANKPENAELLAHFVELKLKSFADEQGHIDQDVLQGLKKEFVNDKKYSSLLAGNQSNGGGAPGSLNGVKADKVTSAEFRAWEPAKQMKYIKDGKTLVD